MPAIPVVIGYRYDITIESLLYQSYKGLHRIHNILSGMNYYYQGRPKPPTDELEALLYDWLYVHERLRLYSDSTPNPYQNNRRIHHIRPQLRALYDRLKTAITNMIRFNMNTEFDLHISPYL